MEQRPDLPPGYVTPSHYPVSYIVGQIIINRFTCLRIETLMEDERGIAPDDVVIAAEKQHGTGRCAVVELISDFCVEPVNRIGWQACDGKRSRN
jgi:hypothetical protein